MKNFNRRFIFILLLFSTALFSWEHHYLLTYKILDATPEIHPDKLIKAESLNDFVVAERESLVKILDEHEQWARKNLDNYAPLPPALRFTGTKSIFGRSLLHQFLLSIRVNPDIGYPLFVLESPSLPSERPFFSLDEQKELPLRTLSALQDKQALRKISENEAVSIKQILASASEEPDHGADLGAFADNKTWFSSLYGFGPQPFGNPQLEYASQAPFHMGFFHEEKLIYFFGDFLKRCYPLYRINLFTILSRHAFATNHDYWGYRFLGLALHYQQDLTQPYHSRAAPGVSTFTLIGINLLSKLGYPRPAIERTMLLTNRHVGLENYQLHNLLASSDTKTDAFYNALTSNAKSYPAYSPSYARDVVAKEAYKEANKIDELMAKVFAKRLMSDGTFSFPADPSSINLLLEAKKAESKHQEELKTAFLDLMKAVGAHTRNMLKHELGNKKTAPPS